MHIAYGYLIFDYDLGDVRDRLFDAIRDEQGIPREEWRPADPGAVLDAAGIHLHASGDNVVVSTLPLEVRVRPGHWEYLVAPADADRVAWAMQMLDIPVDTVRAAWYELHGFVVD